MKFALVLLAIVALFAYADAGASNSLADCLAFAAKFNNSCSGNTPASSVPNVPGRPITCTGITDSSRCPGTLTGTTCVFQHRLCVTCATVSGVTRVRIQTNTLPPRCVLGQVSSYNIDFTVNYNPDVYQNSTYIQNTVLNSDMIFQKVCHLEATTNTPPTFANFVDNSGTGYIYQQAGTIVGIAIDGMFILKPPSADNADPFYPVTTTAPTTDVCLSHATQYHYHSPSYCMFEPQLVTSTPAICQQTTACNSNIKGWMTSQIPTAFRVRSTMGIAMDGHPIIGPYDNDGSVIRSGFDVCNGMFADAIGNYVYVATDVFPYVPSCFGPANYPCATPTCSLNPITAYTRNSFLPAASCEGTGNTPGGAASGMFNMITYATALVLAFAAAVFVY